MQISAINSNLYFKANSKYAVNDKENEKRKITSQEAAVVTGAAGATGSAVAGHSGTFKSFSSVNKKINTLRKLTKCVFLLYVIFNKVNCVFHPLSIVFH